jgi:hypothetical protein
MIVVVVVVVVFVGLLGRVAAARETIGEWNDR